MASTNGAVRPKSRPAPKPRPAPAPVEDAAPVIPQPPAEEAPEPVDMIETIKQFAQYPADIRFAAVKLAAWGDNASALFEATLLLTGLTPAQRSRVDAIAALLAE